MPTSSPRRSGFAHRVAALCMPGALVLAPVAVQARQDAHPAHAAPSHDPKRHDTGHRDPVRHGTDHHPAHHAAPHPVARDHRAGPAHPAARAARHPAPPPVPVPVPVPAPPPPPPTPEKGTSTGLPLPRFAALRADTVNLRSGPGTRYPIQWVYKRKDLPVEVEREFDVWRLVEFADGTKGWVNQATLIGFRTFVVRGDEATAAADAASPAGSGLPAAGAETTAAGPDGLPPGTVAMRSRPDDAADVVAMVKPGTVGRIRACAAGSGWCRVGIRDYTGWLPRRAFWGLLPDETISPP